MSQNDNHLEQRDSISRALLTATTELSHGSDPLQVVKAVCAKLVEITPHIRVAWMLYGDLQKNTLTPQHAIGPAKEYADSLIFSMDQVEGPLRRAIKQWRPVLGDIEHDDVFDAVRERASQYGLKSTVCLPIGKKHSPHAALVAIYADEADFFEKIGLDIFEAFANVAAVAIDQASLINHLTHMANHDQLTQMMNRHGMLNRLEEEYSRSKRHNETFSVILLDVDRFKLINDLLGHSEGDIVLQRVAEIIKPALRIEDHMGRWGGEEFLCLLPHTDRIQAQLLSERLRHLIESTNIYTDSGAVNVTASFGYACFPQDGVNIDKLIIAADAALYQAKADGRNRVYGAHQTTRRIHSVGNQLETALKENRIIAAYQPIVDLQSGGIVANEVLARLVDKKGNTIDASSFIEAADQLQLLHRIDHSVMKQAIEHCAHHVTSGNAPIKHFVNISGDLLKQPKLIDDLLQFARNTCTACGLDPNSEKPVVIEITERDLFDDLGKLKEMLTPFTDFGFQLALDDFGSGYSSYQYLVELPISILKIDGHLIQRIADPKVHAIVKGIQDTANNLGIKTVAEFIEDELTARRVRDIGIDYGQGHFYGMPAIDETQTRKIANN